jgi:hypothetical protein
MLERGLANFGLLSNVGHLVIVYVNCLRKLQKQSNRYISYRAYPIGLYSATLGLYHISPILRTLVLVRLSVLYFKYLLFFL